MKVLLCLGLLAAVAAAKTCTSDGDCTTEECCLHPMFGKRFFLNGFGSSGTCSPLSMQGASCEPPQIRDPFNPKLHQWHCPCITDYECHGDTEVHEGGSHSYTNPKCKESSKSTNA